AWRSTWGRHLDLAFLEDRARAAEMQGVVEDLTPRRHLKAAGAAAHGGRSWKSRGSDGRPAPAQPAPLTP
ncbi:MAG: hypothetical protein ACRD0O_19185, partial [Acidimicrobiia bacterium]